MEKFLENKFVIFLIRVIVFLLSIPKFLYKVCTNGFYRDMIKDEYITPRMNWKTYLLVAVLVIVGIAGKIVHYRWYGLKVCWGEQFDTKRETKYGFIFNSCVIDSGRKDAEGNVIWTKVNRDMNPGGTSVTE